MNRLLDQQFVCGKQFVRDLTPGQNIGPRTNHLSAICTLSMKTGKNDAIDSKEKVNTY